MHRKFHYSPCNTNLTGSPTADAEITTPFHHAALERRDSAPPAQPSGNVFQYTGPSQAQSTCALVYSLLRLPKTQARQPNVFNVGQTRDSFRSPHHTAPRGHVALKCERAIARTFNENIGNRTEESCDFAIYFREKKEEKVKGRLGEHWCPHMAESNI